MSIKQDTISNIEDRLEDSPSSSTHKKHRKHKKKHRHRHAEDNDEPIDVVCASPSNKPAIKLKFKLGGQTFAEKSVAAPEDLSMMSTSHDTSLGAMDEDDEDDTSHTPSAAGNETSDDEREWLDALESGNLDDLGMLKRSRDPNLMTARQRALVHGIPEVDLQELPSGYRTPELTEEQMERRQQRANKRRQLAIEKREKDKKLIVDRLLKKQEAKLRFDKSRVSSKTHHPRFRYVNNTQSITVSVPHGYDLPLQHQHASPPREPEVCGVTGCTKVKKYSCSKTGVALCSLECYKHNLSHHSTRLVDAT